MAQLDFPSNPTNGQIFTGPGGVQWFWDTEKWTGGFNSNAFAPVASPVFTGNPTAPTPPAGDADTSIATTAFVTNAVATSLHDVGRNYLHNSMFNIMQRGTGPWSTPAITLDRWTLLTTLDVTSVSVGTADDSIRTAIGDEDARYYLIVNCAGNAGASANTFMAQKVEGVRRLAGKTITLSFWMRASSGTPKLGLNFAQDFGTGGSPSTTIWGLTPIAVTTSSAWTRYSVTFAVPSAAGKTLGTNGNDCTWIGIFSSSGSGTNTLAGSIGVQTFTASIWGVQLELGPGPATPLEKPDPVTQLQQCQRFFQIGSWGAAGASSAAGAGQTFTMPYPVPMRAMPIMTPTFTLQTNCGSSRVDLAGNYACAPYTINTATGGWAFNGTFTASADL